MNTFKTPILFIAFNRPGPTRRVFEEIRKVRPEKLFVAVDGAREDRLDDVEKVKEVQKIVSAVDWPCELKTLFRDKNLGCKIGATTAVTWFFDHVEEGIIVEDDCLPDPSFFPFCEEMLAHFRHEERVAMICGYNIEGTSNIRESYTFSRYGHLWGWASWRRIWKQYDVTMKIWDTQENRKKIRKAMNDRQQWNYREWLYNETYEGRKDTWDYQWESYRLFHNQICVIPKKNMIKNLGFGADATHTKQTTSYLIKDGEKMEFPLTHNDHIVASDAYDRNLRPLIKAPSRLTRTIKNSIKNIAKQIVPPIVYDVVRNKARGSQPRNPRWNTLSYEPLKGVRMFFDPSGPWQRKMIDGSYDTFMFDRLSALGAKGKVIYDIGAHIGFHSLYFATLTGPQGRVFAFEPNKSNFDRLNMIVDGNPDIKKRVKAFNVAVSDTHGTAEFNTHDDIETGRSSGNFLGTADPFWNRTTYADKGFIKTEVTTVPVDDFATKLGIHQLPDIMKIDVEGAEHLVLMGAEKTLREKKPILFIEIHSQKNMFNVLTFLSHLSYESQIARIEGNGVCYIEAHPKK